MVEALGSEPRLSRIALATIVASRFVLNTIFRTTYPLIQILVVREHFPEQVVAGLVTVQVIAGLLSPLSGSLADRYGHRPMMGAGLLVATMGTFALMASKGLPGLFVGFALVGSGTAIYQPAMQAYVSSMTPRAQRGRVLGIVELSWAVALIVGVPVLVGLLERSSSFVLPFAVPAAALFVMLLGCRTLPPEPEHSDRPDTVLRLPDVLRQRHVVGLLLFFVLVFCGGEVLFVVQPLWLTQRFGASTGLIAEALFVFGVAELGGSSMATLLTDRIGIRRAPLFGFTLAAAIFALLPLLSVNWHSFLVCFALYALCFEFAIVSAIGLASTIEPRARGRVLAVGSTAITGGRAIGSQLGVAILAHVRLGIIANGIVAATLTICGVAIGVAFVHPRE